MSIKEAAHAEIGNFILLMTGWDEMRSIGCRNLWQIACF